jgi:hypothetical protein
MNAAFLVALVLAQNYQGYPIAPRSSGMGGTATALGNGASNTFYNPSAVAWNDESMTGDVSGNLFAGSLTTLSSQFGLETQVPRLGVQIIPSNMSFEWRGLELGPIKLSKKWGLGISVVAPFDVELSSLVSTPDRSTLAIINSLERVYAIYNSIAYRLTDDFGIGLAIVAMYRQFSNTAIFDHLEKGGLFESAVIQQSRKSVSHGLSVGTQWRPANGFRLGGSVRLPVTSVFGFGDDHGRITVTAPNLPQPARVTIDRQVEARYERPWRFNLGLAYERPKSFALAADISAHTPLEYVSERDVATGATLEVTRLVPVLNFSVGGEVFIKGSAVRAGFFTDHSPLPVELNLDTPRINRYGGTISLELERKLYRTEVGILVSVGLIRATTADAVGGTFAPVPVSGTELRGIITYSSTLRFF